MKAIWCAKDKNKAFDDVMAGKAATPASCDIDIADHYALGVQLGVSGTPAIVLSNGCLLYTSNQRLHGSDSICLARLLW